MRRLIDANELMDKLLRKYCKDCLKRLIQCRGCKVDEMTDAVAEAPTIDPKRHGLWIKMSDADGIFYGCSECGEWHKETSNYCPNCGVKMDRWHNG